MTIDNILTYGLNDQQNEEVDRCLPGKGYQVLDCTDQATDLVALPSVASIIKGDALDAEGLDLMFSYLEEMGNISGMPVFWLGSPKPAAKPSREFKEFETFEDLAVNLKYHLLSAHKKAQKGLDFYRKLSYAIQILALIRRQPGISTKMLAEETSLSPRSVQRYIATLQVSGEWIEYDAKKRGWQLAHGFSVLLYEYVGETDS